MKFDKNDRIAIIGSIVFHILILVILFLTVIKSSVPEDDGGILVNFGNIDYAAGLFEPQGTGRPIQEPTPVEENIPPPQPPQTTPEEMVTQDTEETVSLTDKKKEEEERRREEQRLERERQAQAEQRRREEEQRRREQAIRDQVAGAFGSGNADGSQGDAPTGTGNQGNPFGNSNTGPTEGTGGFGSFNLSGRTLRGGGLPSPSYTSQVEGRIVIDITVNPRGDVINSVIGKGTNIDDAALRKNAIEAARQARFNTIQGSNNQSGTITYRFNLK